MEVNNNIKIVNGIMFKDFEQTVEKIEARLLTISYDKVYYDYKKYYDRNVEIANLPAMIIPFYEYILLNFEIPNVEEYIDYYFIYHKGSFTIEGNNVIFDGISYSKNSISQRLTRTYPSLIRNYHFYYKLLESGLFDKVTYSTHDGLCGKNITISHRGSIYEIYLFSNKRKPEDWKSGNKYSDPNINAEKIQLLIDLCTAYKVGDISLYDDSFVEKVYNIINNK